MEGGGEVLWRGSAVCGCSGALTAFVFLAFAPEGVVILAYMLVLYCPCESYKGITCKSHHMSSAGVGNGMPCAISSKLQIRHACRLSAIARRAQTCVGRHVGYASSTGHQCVDKQDRPEYDAPHTRDFVNTMYTKLVRQTTRLAAGSASLPCSTGHFTAIHF